MKFKYKMLLLIFPVIFISDQLTKVLIRSNMAIGEVIPVIPGYFDIVHVVNKGAAFGMFSGTSASFRVPFFYIVTLVAVAIIGFAIYKLKESDRLLSLIFPLILGGIFGNVLDRIMYGQVTDFLSVHLQNRIFDKVIFGHQFYFPLEWPAFNIADSAISVAMVLLIWDVLFHGKENKS